MSFIAPIAKAAKDLGPILEAGGGIASAIGQGRAYGSAAGVMAYNQGVAEQQARLTEQAGAQQKIILEKKKRETLSKMRAQFAFRGVDLTGSPLLALADSAAALELDVQNTEFNSLVAAADARSKAGIYGLEADAYRSAGRTARTSGIITSTNKFLTSY